MTYDAFGRKTGMVDPDMGTWQYGYDPAGHLTVQIANATTKLCFTYDSFGRPLTKFDDSPNASNPTCPTSPPTAGSSHLATYTYGTSAASYNFGRPVTIQWGDSPSHNQESFTYDSRGRVTSHTRWLDGRAATTTITAFDAQNRPTSLTSPSGETITTTYDWFGENSLTAGADALITSMGYNERGQLTTINRAATALPDTSYTYYGAAGSGGNESYRLQQIQSGSLLNLNYQYDPLGNITQLTDNVMADSQNFTYDHLNRLVTANGSSDFGCTLPCYGHTYAYNKLGNITSAAGQSYSYADPQHKQAVTSISPNQSFGYSATFPGGKVGITYFDNFLVSSAEISRSTYAIAGQTIATRISGDPVSSNNGLFYLFSDHLGSTSVLATNTGNPVPGSRATYYPFGSPRTTPTQTITDRNFTGQKENMELGLIYYNARYYVPGIARFLTPDTIIPDITNPQSINPYSYVLNNPLRFVDPSGHRTCTPQQAATGDETCDQNRVNSPDNKSGGQQLINQSDASIIPQPTDALTAAYYYMFSIYYGLYCPDGECINEALPGTSKVLTLYYLAIERVNQDMASTGFSPLAMLAAYLAVDVLTDSIAMVLVEQVAFSNGLPGYCSFSGQTVVTTEDGFELIANLDVGDMVLAYDPAGNDLAYYPVVATWVHQDSIVVYLTIDGETVTTTPEHPFYVVGEGWTPAGTLTIGDEIQSTWGSGNLEAISFHLSPQPMYNLTIATAHTYFVGREQWLVHNTGCNPVENLPRSGSANKLDPFHRFPDIVDNYVPNAYHFQLTSGAQLYQLEGSYSYYNSAGNWVTNNGVFEWVVYNDQVTHRVFIPNGTITGIPNIWP